MKDSPFMKLLLITLILLVAGLIVTGSGALFQSTVDIGEGSIGAVVSEPEEPEGDNTARTLAACQALAESYNACKNSAQREKLGLDGSSNASVNDRARKIICDGFDGEFLPLEADIVAAAYDLGDETLYIQPYFVIQGSKVKYIVLFTSEYPNAKLNDRWNTNAVYFPATETWYEYRHGSLYGVFNETFDVTNFSRFSESTAQYVLENGYTFFGIDWEPFSGN